MLQPKRTKYRKAFKGRIKGASKGGTSLNFGSFGLKALEPERVTARQIEATRRAVTRHMKRQGRVWIRVFPDLPVSAKPIEVRMGKGKGSVDRWVAERDQCLRTTKVSSLNQSPSWSWRTWAVTSRYLPSRVASSMRESSIWAT